MKTSIIQVLMLILILILFMSIHSNGFVIPVHDVLKYTQDGISHYAKMFRLDIILKTIANIQKIERETREFFQNIYQTMQKSKLISARDMLWHIMNSTFFKDLKKQDPWWIVWNSKKKLSEIFPQLVDLNYFKENDLYKKSPRYRQYVDKLILQKQERVKDLENLREHMDLMRKAYIKNIKQINLFSNRLEEFSSANQVGKLIALLANLELMNARLNLQLNFNRRIQDTILLKNKVYEIANYNEDSNQKGILGWKDEK